MTYRTEILESPRHENYSIIRFESGNRVQWTMAHNEFDGYRIAVYPDQLTEDGEALAELLTLQRDPYAVVLVNGVGVEWKPARKGCEGPLSKVKAELEKRGRYWARKNRERATA